MLFDIKETSVNNILIPTIPYLVKMQTSSAQNAYEKNLENGFELPTQNIVRVLVIRCSGDLVTCLSEKIGLQ